MRSQSGCLRGITWVLALLAPLAGSQPQGEGTLWENPHHKFVQKYDGTRTGLQCHPEQGKQAFASVHYQWKADAPNIVNAKGRKLGKLNSTNDYRAECRPSNQRGVLHHLPYPHLRPEGPDRHAQRLEQVRAGARRGALRAGD